MFIIGSVYINILEKINNKIYSEINGDKLVEAIIISEPEDKEYKYRFKIEVESINGEFKYKGIQLLLNLKLKDAKYIPKYGDKILVKGKIEIPNTSRNYKGFNYRDYLKTKKLYGTMEIETIEKEEDTKLRTIDKIVNYVQNNMNKTFNNILSEEEASLCIGILIGYRDNISDEIEDDFKKSNLTHMLAVSGSHITYIINCFAVLLGKTNRKISKISTILFLIFFIVLTGYTASVLRASFMGILVLLSSLLYRKSDTLNNLSISSLIILLINPYTILDIGFILSFAGTLGIILFTDNINNYIYIKIMKKILKNKEEKYIKILNNKFTKYIVNSFSVTLSANLLIIPIMAYSFSTFSFTFWVSNLLAAPIMEIVTILGFATYIISLFIFPLAKLLGVFLNFLLFIMIKIARISSLIPGSSIYIKTPYLYECFIYYILVLYIFYSKRLKKLFNSKYNNQIFNKEKEMIKYKSRKIIALLLIVILVVNILISNNINIFKSNLKIYFIDVGQGDSTLIQTPYKKKILIDGGGNEFGTFDVGENILLPYLLDRRINHIDYIIISHFDSDHVKGLFEILKNIKVDNVIISKQGKISSNFIEFSNIVKTKNIKVKIVKKGDFIKIDNSSYIEILFPEEEFISENILNNNSIVLRFISNKLSMLFTGDIEQIAEKRLCDIYSNTSKLKSDILKVSHHGSKTSSTEEFLRLVNPKVALIGVGKDNNFGHPNTVVLDRIRKYTNKIYRTDNNGEIEIEEYTNKINIDNHINL